jgi:3-oxoacyl-[acyl-carrier protein] reductase
MSANLPTYPDLVGKVAVVTGGSRGIGAETSRVLAKNGVKVAVIGRDAAAIEGVVNQIQAGGGEALGIQADCTRSAEIERMRQQVEQELGFPEILAVFAGSGGEPTPTVQMSEERWHAVIDANLTATFLTVKSFLPAMIEHKRGAIITMASSAGRLPSPASAAYSAAKAGVIMLSRHLAADMGKHGIRVNCIAPSSILTEKVQRQMPPAMQQQVAASFPLGRLGNPEDVALTTLFLASDSAAWLTGLTLDVAGGRISL